MKSHQRRDSPPLAEITVAKISKMSSDVIRSWLHSPEDHGAVLPVKGEVVYRNGTSTTVNGRRQPVNTAVWRHQGIAVQGNLELAVHTIAGKIDMSRTVVQKSCAVCYSLVLQYDIWQPDDPGGDAQRFGDVPVQSGPGRLVPPEPVVTPLLQAEILQL